MSDWVHPVEVSRVPANGVSLHVARAGAGPAILLLHGWPHTWFLWRAVMDALAGEFTVIAPDLRGIGESTRAHGGYDLENLSDDMLALLDALGVERLAAAAGIDAGAPVAWMLAMRQPERVRRLVLMEGLIGTQPGAEAFLARGAPWWFGFHAVPDFAERLLAGREAEYLDFFYESGTFDGRGVTPEARAAFVEAYEQPDAMRCGFEYYRAMPENARQVAAALEDRRLTQPTLAVGGNAVGAALHGQLRHMCDDLEGVVLDRCGHIIPQDQPRALADLIAAFVAQG